MGPQKQLVSVLGTSEKKIEPWKHIREIKLKEYREAMDPRNSV